MLRFLLVLQFFYVPNTGISENSINSKNGVNHADGIDRENQLDSIDFSRISRQANNSKDPYTIVQKQCLEYAKARYLGPKISGKPSLSCVANGSFVVDGVPSKLKEFPHMALIGYNDKNDNVNDVDWRCGGTLISDRYVLTAAHCLTENSVPKWIRLGELVLNDDRDRAAPKDYRIVRHIPHPQYKRPLVQHDIMLFQLNKRVTFTSHIRPICLLPFQDIAAVYNNSGIITGWSLTDLGERRNKKLLKAKIDFSPDNACASFYAKDKQHLPNGFNSSTMICAEDEHGRKYTCQADSGGPLQVPLLSLVCMYSQVGISSYGLFICGTKGVPSIYTKVSYYIPWIQSIVWP